MRVLTFSTLYPSSVRPGHGIFVETRLRELISSGQVESRVVAPVPWFASTDERFGEYALMARTPASEHRNGIDVVHPRYVLLPKVGMSLAPLGMYLGARAAVQKLLDDGFDFDVIDAHYYYPDGVAAALLARHFKKPLTITARGTDLNLIPAYTLPRKMIQWAARKAQASIGVCSALMDVLRQWQVPEDRLHVMRNGVDLQRFHPVPQAQARESLGLQGAPLLMSVGYLIERKGHHLAIEALAHLLPRFPQARLVIVGEGPERQNLQALAEKLGVAAHLSMPGAQPNTELYRWYSAADIFILASSREGWANVLLESMACGTPVVATDIWGTPEVVSDPVAGRLVKERSGLAFARELTHLLAAMPDRALVRRFAEGFSWEATTQAQLQLFGRLSASTQANAQAQHPGAVDA
ncbi:glycosyltransferase family 4 protein [Roseateles koreensis]|nr:glycosyltransferase family 4 protein [Roseateles koreensis]